MTQQKIYSILKLSSDKNTINANITFDENHAVFKGHFPGNPIVPGVIQIQIIKDLLENITQSTLLLKNSKNIKYLNIISPLEQKSVNVIIDYAKDEQKYFKVKALMQAEETVFMKLSGIYELVE